ncbi:LysR family substrate-binding domain-containing protein [Variovorax sp. KK3]|uniref:LysR family substrate-binding domain-containing protein n=1 Tax=Variovorax sp. KK3 TaxID=1855728 RepID=UPI00097BE088|nr:LysR family substrate-binding domain-containing protein [Variovorax sp. KK3]
MNLRRLQYFFEFARRASEDGDWQDWDFVKSHIAALEKELGTELVHKKGPQVRQLTSAGRHYLIEAERLLSSHASAMRIASDKDQGIAGTLRIGLCEEATTNRFASIVASYSTQFPKVRLEVVEGHAAQLTWAVKRRDVDLALTLPQDVDAQLVMHDLWQDRWTVALPRNHALAERVSLGCEDLAQEPLVLADPLQQPHGHEYIRAAFRQAQIEPIVGAMAVNRSTMLMLATIGVGATFVPKSMIRAAMNPDRSMSLQFRAFNASPLQICAVLVVNNPPRIATHFLQVARSAVDADPGGKSL